MNDRDKAAFLEEQLSAAIEVNQHLAQQIEDLHNEVYRLRQQLKQCRDELAEQKVTAPLPPATPPVDASVAPAAPIEKTVSVPQKKLEPESNGSVEPPPLIVEEQPPVPVPQLPSPTIEYPELTGEWAALRSQLGNKLIHSSNITLGPILGEGAFGTTHKAMYNTGNKTQECAVKLVRIEGNAADAFSREVLALSLVQHPNVLRMYGACIEPPEKCWIVCEYLTGGTLAQWLYGPAGSSWPPKRSLLERLRIALDIASGMAALQAHDPPILHRDLKPGNIMLDTLGRARICDMGLARILTEDSIVSLTPETGSYLWMAPEVVRHDLYLTPADVWSFGIILLELLTQKRPYVDLHLTPIQTALAVADGTITPKIPNDAPAPVVRLLKDIFKQNPMMRPAFDTIAAVLNQVVRGLEATQPLPASQQQLQQQGEEKPAWQRWLKPGAVHHTTAE